MNWKNNYAGITNEYRKMWIKREFERINDEIRWQQNYRKQMYKSHDCQEKTDLLEEIDKNIAFEYKEARELKLTGENERWRKLWQKVKHL